LLNTGFRPKYKVIDGIGEVIAAYRSGRIKDEDDCYNIKAMRKNIDLKEYCNV
jgi:hypothetical protein